MGWEARGGGRLYYVSYRKVHGRVTRQYLGTGPAAALAAKAATERRAAREAQVEALRAEDQRHAAAVGPLDELARLTDLLMKATLIGFGYHQHGGEWRRRKHGSTNSDEGLPGRVEGDH
jgi:hypothetical protein